MATALTGGQLRRLEEALDFTIKPAHKPDQPLFENPFKMEDLVVFDRETMRQIVDKQAFGLNLNDLALSVHGIEGQLVDHIEESLPAFQRYRFRRQLHRPAPLDQVEAARQRILDGLFWELTYWKTPELYEELTEGEKLHPGIFQQLAPVLRGKTVLDAGAGSGRASFESLRKGAKTVYAVEPSPGLLNILEGKLQKQPQTGQIVPLRGRFDELPLETNSVDVAISCSAFTAMDEQGGEPGLAELRRVTKPGGLILIIWPRREDQAWLKSHGFNHVALPLQREMTVRFRSLESGLRCARRFYARNQAVVNYLLHRRTLEVPFSVLGFNPPHDYCWQRVKKGRA